MRKKLSELGALAFSSIFGLVEVYKLANLIKLKFSLMVHINLTH